MPRRTPGDVIRAGDVTLDKPRMQAQRRRAARSISPPTEFELLATLAGQPGRVFTRAQLLDAIRGEAVESFDRAIDAHIKNLRRKLEPEPRNPRYVLTVHGVGYKFADSMHKHTARTMRARRGGPTNDGRGRGAARRPCDRRRACGCGSSVGFAWLAAALLLSCSSAPWRSGGSRRERRPCHWPRPAASVDACSLRISGARRRDRHAGPPCGTSGRHSAP